MNKKIILLFTMLLSIQAVLGAASQSAYFSSGSDFLILQNPQSTQLMMPEIYALYDNTKVMVDINDDGAYDYETSFDKGALLNLNFPWNIKQGSRILSDKPVHYIQSFYFNEYLTSSHQQHVDMLSTVPPTASYKKEYLAYPEKWYLISDKEAIIYVDEDMDGSIDNTINLTSGLKAFTASKYARLFSNDSFFAYSKKGFASQLSNDFFSNEVVVVLISSGPASVEVDINVDGIPDASYSIGVGPTTIDTQKGARITTTADIAAYGYVDGTTKAEIQPKSYFPLPPSNTVSDEFTISVRNNFFMANNAGHEIIGLLNPWSGWNAGFDVKLFSDYPNLYKLIEYVMTGNTVSLDKGFFEVISDTPLLDRFYYYYNNGYYTRYYLGHKIAYKQIYLASRPKSRYITPNSSSIFNVRVFNPFRKVSAENVRVKFRYSGLSMPVASANYRKAELDTDNLLESSSQAVISGSDALGNYFIFSYGGVMEGGTYLDIDFSLLMPNTTGMIRLEPAELDFQAETWII